MLKADFSCSTSLWRIIQTEWKWWLSGALISFVLASVLMSGWPEGLLPNLQYPYTYSGDGLSSGWMIQRAIEGWIFDNPRSGYPFGSSFLDFPGSDSGNHLILKLIGLLTGEYQSALNLYFLLGFSVTFAVSFCVFRAIGLALPFAISAAALFDLLPFHFQRIDHLYYTWYFVVPVFYYLALRCFSLKVPYENTNTTLTKNIFYFICLLALGSFGVYYAIFGLILFLIVAIARIAYDFHPKVLAQLAFASGIVILGVLLNIAPNLIQAHKVGPNPEVAQRSPAEAEIYGLKLMQLTIPRLQHREPLMGQIAAKYSASTPLVNENSTSSLGVVGALGFLAMLGVIFTALAGKQLNATLKIVALIVLILFLLGTIGGLGSLFSHIVSSSIRGWNRISVFIGFGALLGVFILIQLGFKKYSLGKKGLPWLGVASILIFAIGFYDQTIAACRGCNELTKQAFHMDKVFVRSIENSLPAGSAIYQLPYMGFPEVPPLHHLQTYDLSVGFLHSSSLRWSYAGMKGRGGDLFYRNLAKEPLVKQLDVIKRLGFAGIYIDRRGFEDNGQKVVGDLTSILGMPPTLTRSDGEVVFFKITQATPVIQEVLSPEQAMQKADYGDSRYTTTLAEGINFSLPGQPIFIANLQGLSAPESWGRWSDANLGSSVRIDFKDPLPNHFNLIFSAQAFGPNAGRDLEVRIGSQTHRFKTQAAMFEYRESIDLAGEKVSRIEFIPPQPTAPQQLNLGADGRKLGIGLARLSLIPNR